MSADDVRAVDVGSAATCSAECVLLDVREEHEWLAGHAPTAIHIPTGELMTRTDEIDITRRVICICRSGNRSARVTHWLRDHGYDAVNMTGGMNAWASSGHPMVDQAGNPGVVV